MAVQSWQNWAIWDGGKRVTSPYERGCDWARVLSRSAREASDQMRCRSDRPPARAIFSTWEMERRSGVLIAVVSFLPPAAHEALSRMPARGKRPQAFRNASAV